MKRETAASMIGIVNQWRESELPMRIFAQKQGITKGKLEYWVRKMSPADSQGLPYPAFIEVGSVSSHQVSPVREKTQTQEKLQIELTFPSGLCLKIFG